MPQRRLKILCATTKTQHRQINTLKKKKERKKKNKEINDEVNVSNTMDTGDQQKPLPYKYNHEAPAPGIPCTVLTAFLQERRHELEKVQGKAAKKVQRTGNLPRKKKLEGLGL